MRYGDTSDPNGAMNRLSASENAMTTDELEALEAVQRRILWLSTRMVDAANRRPKSSVKVGGHQASSASAVSIMTALWFAHLDADDMVAVKPHASPVYHAINYLIGDLDPAYLTTLRARGGLQAYPSRTKDPDRVDFSTGSVGLGAIAPLFAAMARRYASHHFSTVPSGRFFALVGDAELDEGSIWEAVLEPGTADLGNFTLVVDLNRQSLDRVVPAIQVQRLAGMFAAAGWHVAQAKYGPALRQQFARPGGDALRHFIDSMSNEAYQSLLALRGDALRQRLLSSADAVVRRLLGDVDDEQLFSLLTDLGGHDLDQLVRCLRCCDEADDRPSALFAYTVKGWGLHFAGDPLNHAALLPEDRIDELRRACGLDPASEWDRFAPETPAGRLCEATAARLRATHPVNPRFEMKVPTRAGRLVRTGVISTQEAFGRTMSRLADDPQIGARLVTVAPDVSISTNLGGWINKVGVFSARECEVIEATDQLLKWNPSPSGQHIELGISEMNLFMLLGQLGMSDRYHSQQLLPVGTVYDPFVLRGLDALIYSLYNGSRFVFAGTPSGVTLAPEGGAHQSTITASVGLELPGLHFVEPCFATEVDWLLCEALRRIADGGESTYLRLSTRPIDQSPFEEALKTYGEERLQRMVTAGGYRLAEHVSGVRPAVVLATTGAMVPETLEAAAVLDDEGVDSVVLHLTSPDAIYRSWQATYRSSARRATVVREPSVLLELMTPTMRSAPVVSIQDAASHSLAWIGSAVGAPQVALGVDQFGESGTVADLHDITGISSGNIVNAAVLAVHEFGRGPTAG